MKALQFLKPLDRFTECIREIKTEFWFFPDSM
jgi:hypothetical protein